VRAGDERHQISENAWDSFDGFWNRFPTFWSENRQVQLKKAVSAKVRACMRKYRVRDQ
jgi:hypothetical protein